MSNLLTHELAALFSASDDISLFIWEHSPGWPVLHCTENVVELVGYTREEFESRQVKFTDTVHPEDVQRVAEEVRQGIARDGSKSFTHEDYRLVTKGGQIIWVADTTLIKRDTQDHGLQLVGYMQNITARKSLELALISERRHLQMVLEGTRLGSWDWNPLSNTLTVNQRWMNMYGFDTNRHPPSMQFWESLLHPDDRADWHRRLQTHLYANTPYYEHVYRIRHARGHYVHVLDRGKVVEWDELGRAVRFAGTHTDISKQKQAELEARKAANSRTVFLANMSHEIRTPLHGILGLASLLASTDLNDYQRELLQTILESGDYLLTTLNDAIDISRADQGKLAINKAPHNTTQLSHHLQVLFAEHAQRQGIDYHLQCDASVPEYVVIDKTRVLQIAVNLVNNAFKFTKSGFIRVDLRWHHDRLILMVEDSGVGIENTEKIWHVFEQESAGTEFSSSGSGLGLGIVRSLVQLMGGQIQVHSQPGQGSCFVVELPAEASRAPTDTPTIPPPLLVHHILIIDDNDTNQLILGEMLNKLDQVYMAASSAQTGLDILQRQEFDVVFMDIHMPDMDGIRATQLIRRQTTHQPYIIGLTANALPSVHARAMAAGMDAYLTKPFQLEEIRNALQAVPLSLAQKNLDK